MDENRFWSMIESAWKAVGGKAKARQRLAEGKLSDDRAEELAEGLDEVIPALREQLAELPAEELLAFHRILERKLYDIDRADVQSTPTAPTTASCTAAGSSSPPGRRTTTP